MSKYETYGSELEIGKRLKEYRIARNETQDQIAKGAGIARSKISELESGKRKLNCADAFYLSQYFRISIDELLRGVQSDYVNLSRDVGLHNIAIERLLEFKENETQYIGLLNLILSDEDVVELLFDSMQYYINHPVHEVKLTQPLDEPHDIPLQYRESDLAAWGIVSHHIHNAYDKLYRMKKGELYDKLDKYVNALLQEKLTPQFQEKINRLSKKVENENTELDLWENEPDEYELKEIEEFNKSITKRT